MLISDICMFGISSSVLHCPLLDTRVVCVVSMMGSGHPYAVVYALRTTEGRGRWGLAVIVNATMHG